MPGIGPRTPIKLVQLMLSCKNWTTTSPHNPLDASVSHPATTQYVSSEHLHKSGVLGSIPSDWQPFHFLYFHLITTLFQCEARVLIRIIFIFYVGLPCDGLIAVSRPTLHWALFGSNLVAGYHGYQCSDHHPSQLCAAQMV